MAEPETKAAPKAPDRRRRKDFIAADAWSWTTDAYLSDAPQLVVSPDVFDYGQAPFDGF